MKINMKTDAEHSYLPSGFYSLVGRWHRSRNSSGRLEGGLKRVSFIFHGFNHHICAHADKTHPHWSIRLSSVNLCFNHGRVCVCVWGGVYSSHTWGLFSSWLCVFLDSGRKLEKAALNLRYCRLAWLAGPSCFGISHLFLFFWDMAAQEGGFGWLQDGVLEHVCWFWMKWSGFVVRYFQKSEIKLSAPSHQDHRWRTAHSTSIITLATDSVCDFTPCWLLLLRMTSVNSIRYLLFVSLSRLPAPHFCH